MPAWWKLLENGLATEREMSSVDLGLIVGARAGKVRGMKVATIMRRLYVLRAKNLVVQQFLTHVRSRLLAVENLNLRRCFCHLSLLELFVLLLNALLCLGVGRSFGLEDFDLYLVTID